jgi:hypothetical protein
MMSDYLDPTGIELMKGVDMLASWAGLRGVEEGEQVNAKGTPRSLATEVCKAARVEES